MPYLNVGDGHQLYYQIQGDIHSATPLLFLHGGPGAGVRQGDIKLFAGLRRPVIFLDQRGCGHSRFSERLQDNTSDKLVADIEQLRQTLAIEKFILADGSWGSTLARADAIMPSIVDPLLLAHIVICKDGTSSVHCCKCSPRRPLEVQTCSCCSRLQRANSADCQLLSGAVGRYRCNHKQ